MASRHQAERWLALEFLGVVVVRTIHGFHAQQGLLGPQQYGAIVAGYGMLSVLVLSDTTAELGAVFGALILLAVLLRPTDTGRPLGADTARAVAAYAEHVGTNPPSLARGVAK